MMPKSPVAILTQKQVEKIYEVATEKINLGVFNPNILEEFVKSVQAEQGDNDVILIAIRRDDAMVPGVGTIFAEIQSDPKKYVGVIGRIEEGTGKGK